MQLHGFDPKAHSPFGGGYELIADALQVVVVKGVRRHLALPVRHRRGRFSSPAIGVFGRNLLAAVPGRRARCLAPGMGDLDTDRDRRMLAHGIEHAGQGSLAAIVVEAEIPGSDPSLRRDRGGLQGEQAGAGHRELAQMHQVPVGGLAIAGRVLAHRRDEDAVLERERVERQRFEQFGGH